MTEPAPPLCTWTEQVRDEWIDYNGHLSEAYYVLVFGHATDAVMDHVGLGPAYRAANDASLFTVEAHVRYLDQVPGGAGLEVRSAVIGATAKLLWLWHEMWVEDRLRATEEVLGVHVDTVTGRSTPFPPDVERRVAAVRIAPGPHAGRRIRLPDPAGGGQVSQESVSSKTSLTRSSGSARRSSATIACRSCRGAPAYRRMTCRDQLKSPSACLARSTTLTGDSGVRVGVFQLRGQAASS